MSKNESNIQEEQNPQKLIHKGIFFAALATPIMTLPQVYAIWLQNNKGTSPITWGSYVIIACVWLYYGLETKDKPIIMSQSLSIVVYSFIVVGLLL